MDRQDCGCSLPDVYQSVDLITCLKCGSSYHRRDGGSGTESPTSTSPDATLCSDTLEIGVDQLADSQSPAANLKPFTHEMINQKHEIRILRVYPGDFTSPVRCSISHEHLQQILPLYEALSYTWADETGDKSKRATILVNDRSFSVTVNCERAIRRIRLTDRSRLVWVDAICINQESDNERTHQVQLMADIYARASAVLIYIGEARHRSTEVLKILGNSLVTDDDCKRSLEKQELEGSMALLLSRPYFWRVWVLQEIAWAKRASLICGDTSIPWETFAGRHIVRSCPNLHPAHLLSEHVVPVALEAPSEAQESYLTALPPALGLRKAAFRDIDKLLPMLDAASFCDASDARDRVFALYSLVTGIESHGLLPDYGATVEDVYLDIATFIAAACGPMALLSRAVCRPCISRWRPWVPDWRQPQSPFPAEQQAKIMRGIKHTTPALRKEPVALDRRDSLRMDLVFVCSLADLLVPDPQLALSIFPADQVDAMHLIISRIGDSPDNTLETDIPACAKQLHLCAPVPCDTYQPCQASKKDILSSECLILVDRTITPLSPIADPVFRGLCTLRFDRSGVLWNTPEFSKPGHLWSNVNFRWGKSENVLDDLKFLKSRPRTRPYYPTALIPHSR